MSLRMGVKLGLSLRVFDKRILIKMFRPKRDKVTEEWRKL
jgi:hypothetical protein